MRTKFKVFMTCMVLALSMVFISGCGIKQVTLTFETNQGDQLPDMKVDKGLPLSELPSPVREGYDFIGWFYDVQLSNPVDLTIPVQRNMVFYAEWAIQTYQVRFVSDEQTLSTNEITYGETITFPDNPVKVGYHFLGWFVNDDLFNHDTIINQDTELVAKFALEQYTITFDLGNGSIETIELNYGEVLQNLPSSILTPEAGKTIVWRMFTDNTLGDIADFSNITADMVVKSVYDDVYLNVQINDGLGNVTSISVKYGDTFEKPSVDPVKEHHVFAGWVDSNQLQYDFFSPVTEDMTIYASFDIQSFQVSFYNPQGQIIGEPKNVDYGMSATAPTYIPQDGYQFVGWDKAFDSVTENLQVMAVVQGLTYSVTYHTNGGSSIESYETTIGEGLTRPQDPTKTGYTFSGWYLDEMFTNEYIQFSTMPYQGLHLYAKWNPNQYTITLDPQQGQVTQTNFSVTFAEAISILPTPNRLGYQFVGWSSIQDNSDSLVNEESIYNTASNATLYAIWTPAQYAISLFVNGGDSLSDNTVDVYYLDQVHDLIIPTREGYTFLGWNTQSNGLGTTFTTETIYQHTTNISLYAIWQANNYTLAYMVEYYFENAEDDAYSLGELISYSGSTDESVEAIIHEYTGFVYDQNDNRNVLSGTVLSDGSLVLKVYYNRARHEMTLVDSSNTLNGVFTLKYGETMSELVMPNREGYTFLGWIDSTSKVYTELDTLEEDVTLYARWKQLSYQVNLQRIFTKDGLEIASSSYNISVAYGSLFSPVTQVEGYDFTEFVDWEDQVYTIDEDTLLITKDQTITVYYELKSFTITFTQFLTTAEDIEITSFTVFYDDSFTNVPALILNGNPAYSLVIWNQSVFQNIRSNIDVYALYYPAGAKSISFVDDGTIKYIATEDQALPDGSFLTVESPLWNLNKPGYVFLGWFYDQEGTNPVQIGDLDFDLITSSMSIYAIWQKLERFEQPSNVSVQVQGTEISILWNQSMLDNAFPTEFILLIDGVEHVLSSTMFSHTGDLFSCNESFLDSLKVPGTHHVAILALGDNQTNLSSVYSSVFEHIVETEEENITDVKVYDYFIIETLASGNLNYIFYTDMTYNFADKYHFVVLEGTEFITSNGNQLVTTGSPGNFVIMMTKTVDSVSTQTMIQGKVVTYINQFQLGFSLRDYLNEQAESNYLNPNFEQYKIGYRNDYYFDLLILDNTGSEVDMAQTTLDFTFYIKNGSTYTLLEGADLTQYIYQKPGNLFRFTSSAVNESFKVEIKPRYQATQMVVPTRTFEFVVEDAYNVFTNKQLQELYSDMFVHHVILHSDITAEVDPRYLNEDGTPMNGYAQVLPSGTIDYRGNVYQRVGVSSNDTFTLDGNYFTIDGSDLPFLKTTSDPTGGYTDVGVGTGSTYGIVSVQVGIFLYNVTPDPTRVVVNNDNTIYYKNLTVLGNTTTPSVNYSLSAEEILEQEMLMSRNSGGHAGIMSRNGTTYLDNVNIGYTTISLFLTAYGYRTDGITPIGTYTNYIRTYDAWANSFYNYGSPLIDITNSEIGRSGGAAIHIEDVRPGNTGIEDITVNVDNLTQINNWVSGDEAWFKAYGFSSIALLLKSQAEGAMAAMDKTIIRMEENQITGALSEKINFVLLSRDMTAAETYDAYHNQLSGSEDILSFGDDTGVSTVDRAFNFLAADFRSLYVSPGTLLFALGQYSNSEVFYNSVLQAANELYPTLSQFGYTSNQVQEIAVQAIYIAGCYNLTIQQAEDVVLFMGQYGGTVMNAVLAITQGNLPPQPKYLEIAQAAPGLGKVQLLLELANKVE